MKKIQYNRFQEMLQGYQSNWNKFARDIFGTRLDRDQQEILHAVQTNRRISVRSGNARGKDFVAATASLCFLYLNNPSKVINIAPTDRQAKKIMMTEIRKIHKNARFPLGGEIFENQIKFPHRPERYLLAFKAVDYRDEVWTGFHSPHLMVVVTEASGIEQQTFENIESILTGDSRLLIVFNPNRATGEAYNSAKSPLYQKFKLSCLDAPNVKARKIIIPGQVDYDWVEEKVKKWCARIDPPAIRDAGQEPSSRMVQPGADHCFQFNGNWYKPNDLFLIKVLAEFPEKSEDQLIPLAWIEAANERWEKRRNLELVGDLRLGVDIAGMGTDLTVYCYRYDNFVKEFQTFQRRDLMENVGHIKTILAENNNANAIIDTIGMGAGVFSRLQELKMSVTSGNFAGAAKHHGRKIDLTDVTRMRQFANMRAYCYWAIRDALDPQSGISLTLPPLDELTQDLTEPRWSYQSDGKILIEEKSEIKKRLGRSPDFGDALALTYFPIKKVMPWDPMCSIVWHKPQTYMDWQLQCMDDEIRWHHENMELRQQGIIRGRSTIGR